ncbi:hypothetical protein FJTKL_02324 [Diaporthe vaccinii]|uniref:Choline dehydrogenase n=1 Tax=Diaporthe vaccinii TaxID=105482 RepID=A0ABR4F3P0_9PEZI
MWPFAAYPEVTAAQVDRKTYDYVIVGGGTAGCVLASRLSEDPNVSVLVLEKGYVKDNFVSRVPLISQNFWMGHPLQVQSTRYSEPLRNVNGRKNHIVTAEAIGGATRINAMLWTRGVPGGYEEWATTLGLDEWAWEKVEPCFRKLENALCHPDSPERGHNDSSPFNTRPGASSGQHMWTDPRESWDCPWAEIILLLSGIGPQSQLDALEIPVKKHLPVGASLQDHFSAAIMLELPKSETLTGSLLETIYGAWHFLLFILFGKGLMGASSTPKTAFVCTGALDEKTMMVNNFEDFADASKPANIPDTEIMVHPVNSLGRPVPGHSLLTFYTTLVQPKSVGRVELVNRDPLTNPRIHHPMFDDPQDMITFRKGIRFSMRMAEEFLKSGYPHHASIAFAPGVNPELLDSWEKDAPNSDLPAAPPPAPGLTFSQGAGDMSVKEAQSPVDNKTWKTVSDDEIDDYVRRVSMGSLHSSCTCPMSRDETSGVVDQHLRVHGFKNLRIADASVFPKIPSGHTMAPTMMVAERCASFIINQWSDKDAARGDS